MTTRDPFDYFVNLADGGRARTPRDRLILDLQGYAERAKYLRKRVGELRHPLLANSSGAAYDATEHERELAKVNRKMAKLWKALDATDAPAPN